LNVFAGVSYAGNNLGVYRSTNEGQSWTQTGLNNQDVTSLAVSESNVFAGTRFGGVFCSTDNGQTWMQTSNFLYVNAIAISGSNVFAGTLNDGVFMSTDNGQTWTQTSIQDQYVSSLAVSGSNIFAGTNSGVYLNWKQTASNFLTVISLATSGSNVFAGTWDSGLYRSTDNGQIWTQTSLMIQYVNLGIASIAINDSNVFAVTYCYTCDPIHQGDEYAILFISTDSGLNWSQTSFSIYVYSVEVSGSIVFTGTSDGVFRSTDDGLSWTQTTLNNQDVYELAGSGSNIFAQTYSGVYRSTDNGQSWSLSLSNQNVNSLAISGSYVFVGTGDGVTLSTDNGQNWTQTPLNNIDVNALTASSSNVFAGTWDSGVYLSTDFGDTWSQINEGIGNERILSLALSSDYIFAGTWGTSVWRRPLSEIITSIEETTNGSPSDFILEQNYPNPFNSSTTIKYSIPTSEFVTLKVYDVLGNEVATLVNEEKPAGNYAVKFNVGTSRDLSLSSRQGSALTSGIYFYKLQVGNFIETKKMLLLK